MLTKDLLRLRNHKDNVKPLFLPVSDARVLRTVQDLIDLFAESEGRTQDEITEASDALVDEESRGPGIDVIRGLRKLLFDVSEFENHQDSGELPPPERRARIFAFTSALLARQGAEAPADFTEFQRAVAREFGASADDISGGLYSDLPMYNRLRAVPPTTPEALIHRYNCALVQGLLFSCTELRLTLRDAKTAELRRLFRYLRFFQLCAEVSGRSERSLELRIDGPLSLFLKTQKYGLQLASFFPAVLQMPRWELRAEVEPRIGAKRRTLLLDETSGLRSHFRHQTAFIPEVIQAFSQAFEKKAGLAWDVEFACEPLVLPGGETCFPDFSFVRKSGGENHNPRVEVRMEIFHPWHRGPLVSRLRHLDGSGNRAPRDVPLLLAVSKQLLKDDVVKQATLESPAFSQVGFTFREMPLVDDVLARLRRVAGEA